MGGSRRLTCFRRRRGRADDELLVALALLTIVFTFASAFFAYETENGEGDRSETENREAFLMGVLFFWDTHKLQ